MITLHQCQNCDAIHPECALAPIQDLGQRVEPGEPMPSGECPDCGALCQPVSPPATEPTEQGLQYVMPGCERKRDRIAGQTDFWK